MAGRRSRSGGDALLFQCLTLLCGEVAVWSLVEGENKQGANELANKTNNSHELDEIIKNSILHF